MHPLLRIWAISAACIALILMARGAFALAVAFFLFSPAPVLLFSHGYPEQQRLSTSWLVLLGAVLVALAIVLAVVVYLGGVPPIHEWRGGGGAGR